MLISKGSLTSQALAGEVAIVTGAGQGIGYEAARALAWLGAQVTIAEIDRRVGQEAADCLNRELGRPRVTFVRTDVGDEQSIKHLAYLLLQTHGKVDVVINNATVAPLGAVKELPIEKWDLSYKVNLRGPVLLARAFLPGMVERNHGVFACVSSTGGPYMGAYEILKAAQVELANTLDAELEGTNVIAFTIGPGVAPTRTAVAAIEQLAPLLGQSTVDFYASVQNQFITIEAAGAGFAAAVALAPQFRGQEIGSIQALQAAGINLTFAANGHNSGAFTAGQLAAIQNLSHQVSQTLATESSSWQQRSIFERQWLIRTFKKYARLTTAQWLERLAKLEQYAQAGDTAALADLSLPLDGLASYYGYLYQAAQGYVKDAAEREEQLHIVRGWQEAVEKLAASLTKEAQ